MWPISSTHTHKRMRYPVLRSPPIARNTLQHRLVYATAEPTRHISYHRAATSKRMRTTMDAEAESAECYAKGCSEPATTSCDRCGRLFCPTHGEHIVVQRRDERTGQPTHQGVLVRLPTRVETYALCTLCRKKPVPLKPPQRAL